MQIRIRNPACGFTDLRLAILPNPACYLVNTALIASFLTLVNYCNSLFLAILNVHPINVFKLCTSFKKRLLRNSVMDPDPDPGGQKRPTKMGNVNKFHFLMFSFEG
jgi:hypothetical protein